MRWVGNEPNTSWIDERVRRNIKEKNKMSWVGIEPTTSWIDERVRRNIKEKNKMRWVGIEPTNSWKKLREKLREREWVCGGLIPQSICLKLEREEGKERKYYGGDGIDLGSPKSEKSNHQV